MGNCTFVSFQEEGNISRIWITHGTTIFLAIVIKLNREPKQIKMKRVFVIGIVGLFAFTCSPVLANAKSIAHGRER